jgi:acyl-coenzyme A thioesterase PaaI-like protein
MTFNSHLGLRLSEDGASILLDPQPEHEAAPGVVHFAVLATLAEVAAAHAAAVPVVPSTVTVQLLRRSKTERLEARGRVIKAGRTLIFAEGEVFQNGELVAKAAVTFAVV